MTADCFLDANIFLYASSAAPDDARKQARATELITEENFGVSSQVLQEFISNALRKPRLGISERGIDSFIELTGQVPVLPVTHELIATGLLLRRRYHIPHWDSTILAASLALGCHTLYSEDFSHGQKFAALTVINPFQ